LRKVEGEEVAMPACIACRSRDVESVCSGAYMAESSDVIYLGSSPVVECPACGTKPLRCQPELYGDVFVCTGCAQRVFRDEQHHCRTCGHSWMHPDLEELLDREEETAEAAVEVGEAEALDEGEAAVLEVLPQDCEACGATLWALVRIDGRLMCRCRCGAVVAPGGADRD
jgi:hypothetical protein